MTLCFGFIIPAVPLVHAGDAADIISNAVVEILQGKNKFHCPSGYHRDIKSGPYMCAVDSDQVSPECPPGYTFTRKGSLAGCMKPDDGSTDNTSNDDGGSGYDQNGGGKSQNDDGSGYDQSGGGESQNDDGAGYDQNGDGQAQYDNGSGYDTDNDGGSGYDGSTGGGYMHGDATVNLSEFRIVTIQQKSTMRYLDAHESAGSDFRLVTRPKQNNRSQQWEITALGNDTYTLQQKSNGRYIDAHEYAKKDFSLVTRPAQHNNTQRWIIKGLGNNLFTIQQKSNGRFVDAHESEKRDYDVVTRPSQNNNSQRWLIKRLK